MGIRRRWAAIAPCLFTALVVAAAASASPAESTSAACSVLPGGAVRSIDGLQSSMILRNYDATTPNSEAARTECMVGAWSGATPKSQNEVFQLARRGRGAAVGVETWRPNDGSPNVQRWLDTGYDELTGSFDKQAVLWPGLFSAAGMPAKHFQPPALGQLSNGIVFLPGGKAKGLKVALGCWWNDQTSSAICLYNEEAAFRPVVKHLVELAKVAVPSFL